MQHEHSSVARAHLLPLTAGEATQFLKLCGAPSGHIQLMGFFFLNLSLQNSSWSSKTICRVLAPCRQMHPWTRTRHDFRCIMGKTSEQAYHRPEGGGGRVVRCFQSCSVMYLGIKKEKLLPYCFVWAWRAQLSSVPVWPSLFYRLWLTWVFWFQNCEGVILHCVSHMFIAC